MYTKSNIGLVRRTDKNPANTNMALPGGKGAYNGIRKSGGEAGRVCPKRRRRRTVREEGTRYMESMSFFDIPGLRVGHAQDETAATGCTVVVCEDGAVAGVDVRGGAPGTRETDLLDPRNLVERIHAVVLAGGSAFGLDAASGVMELLERRGIGFDVGVTKVPIVCSAVLFDLLCGDWSRRPDREMAGGPRKTRSTPNIVPRSARSAQGRGRPSESFSGTISRCAAASARARTGRGRFRSAR